MTDVWEDGSLLRVDNNADPAAQTEKSAPAAATPVAAVKQSETAQSILSISAISEKEPLPGLRQALLAFEDNIKSSLKDRIGAAALQQWVNGVQQAQNPSGLAMQAYSLWILCAQQFPNRWKNLDSYGEIKKGYQSATTLSQSAVKILNIALQLELPSEMGDSILQNASGRWLDAWIAKANAINTSCGGTYYDVRKDYEEYLSNEVNFFPLQ
jgi:hypothetical protein